MAAKDQQVIPMIAYEDGAEALDWLAAAFGFHERTRMTGKDGRISHAEMEAGDGLIMLASPTPDYEGPRRHRVGCEPARKWSSVPLGDRRGARLYRRRCRPPRTSKEGRCHHPLRAGKRCSRSAVSRRGHRGSPMDVHGAPLAIAPNAVMPVKGDGWGARIRT